MSDGGLGVCERCGAVVGDAEKHRVWHGWLSKQIASLVKLTP